MTVLQGRRNHGRTLLEAPLWGAVTGAVAGLILAVQILLQNPGIRGFQDRASVLVFFPLLYLAIGGALGVGIGLLAALLLRRWGVRGESAATAAISIGGVATLLVMADALGACSDCHVWYRQEWPSLTVGPVRSFFMMAGVIARSIVIGVLIGAIIHLVVRRTSGRRSLRFVLPALGGAVALGWVAFAVLRPLPAATVPRYSPALAADSGLKVRFVMIDGADWRFVQPLVDSGRMPHTAALMARGACGPLGIHMPCVSPYMWTTISTGFTDEIHGLCDFYAYRPPGGNALVTRYPGSGDTSKRLLIRRLAIPLARLGIGRVLGASSGQKRVPEIWDYAGMAGKRVCVVGWRYSYPATAVNGVMVSDRFEGQPMGGDVVYPPALARDLPRDFSSATEAAVRRIVGEELASRTPEESGEDLALRLERIRLHILHDITYAAVGRALFDSLTPDLGIVGLTAVDALEHRFMLEHVFRQRPQDVTRSSYLRRFSSEDDLARFGPTLERVYAGFDSLLGVLIADAGDELIVVASDHGHDLDGSGHRNGPPGILIMAGGPVCPGSRLEGATVRDLVPTLLWCLGLPVFEGFPGRVLAEAFEPGWLAAHPVRVLRLVGGEGAATPTQDLPGLTEEEVEQLRSLGYVE
ncbi:MAG: alkaline phosphatase family protein [Candidatus Eisenbacteria bacterium]